MEKAHTTIPEDNSPPTEGIGARLFAFQNIVRLVFIDEVFGTMKDVALRTGGKEHEGTSQHAQRMARERRERSIAEHAAFCSTFDLEFKE